MQYQITDTYPPNGHCERCTISLSTSTLKGVKVVYRKNSSKKHFLCLKCAEKREKVTIDDLDRYISEHLISNFMRLVFA